MATSTSTPERILQRLDWQVIRRLDGLLQGDYRSLFRGNGVDFADLREYQYGDDIRYIDWSVTARMDTPYVREYLEDREITAWFLLDLSPSVDFGTGETERLKRSVLIDFVTTLARLLTRHGNRVGAVFYGSRVERTIPARGGRIQVLRLINDLLSQPRLEAAPFTDLTPLLEAGQHSIKGRSLVFVISDFISAPGWERSLNLLTQRHEVLAVRLFDRREVELPDVGPLIMEDAETGEQLYVDTHDKAFRRALPGGRRAARGDASDGLQAIRRRRRLAVDRRGPGRGDRPDGRAPPAAAAVAMSFIWPPMLLLALLIPLGVLAYLARERRRRRRLAELRRLAGDDRRAIGRRRARRLRRRLPAALIARRPGRSSSSRWPGRRASSACRASRARSSSPSTCRAAWPPPTCRRPGWRRPRRPPAAFVETPAGVGADRGRRVQRQRASRSRSRPTTRRSVAGRDRPARSRARDVDRPAASRPRSRRSPPPTRIRRRATTRTARPDPTAAPDARAGRARTPRPRSSC